jgi:hypothetical protein
MMPSELQYNLRKQVYGAIVYSTLQMQKPRFCFKNPFFLIYGFKSVCIKRLQKIYESVVDLLFWNIYSILVEMQILKCNPL